MSSDKAYPEARTEGLVVERVDGELLVYDRQLDRAHHLDETAALVYAHCDGGRSASELASYLSAKAGRPIAVQAVEAALEQLDDALLLAEPLEPSTQRETSTDGTWSRRQVVRRIGLAGAAATVGLPVVRSIVVPTPAAAQSAACLPLGTQCLQLRGFCFQGPTPCCMGACKPSGGGGCICSL